MKQIRSHKPMTYILCACILLYMVQVLFHSWTKPPYEETIPILGFHNVVYDEEKEAYYPYNMWVDSQSAFQEKIAYLHEQGYKTWTLDELYEWKQGKRKKEGKVVILTFDDGYYASSHVIAPILKQYGYTATTFVIGSALAQDHTWDGSKLQYLSRQDMMDQSTMQYASHTYALHGKTNGKFQLDVATKEQLQQDLEQQRAITSIDYVAYPYGHYNDTAIEVLQHNGVKLAFGYHENKMAAQSDDPYKLPRFAITSYTTMDSFQAMLESR